MENTNGTSKVKNEGKVVFNKKKKKEALLKALEKTLGVVTSACKLANVSRVCFYDYYAQDEKFKKAVDELQNVALDFAESKLHKKIEEGSDTAIIFYLKTKGKNRGYIERIEHVNKEVETFEKTEEEIIQELEHLKSKIK
jgi:hypothetical protein